MANRSKDKGNREERALVNDARDVGLQCERTLEAGARSDGSDTWDVNLIGADNTTFRGECKIRKDGFKEIYKWMTGVDFLTIRADGRKRLVVLDQDLFFKFLKK